MVIFIVVMVTLAGVGQLFIKSGVGETTARLGGFPSNIPDFFTLVFYWKVFVGLAIYFVFGITWLKILSDVPVSFAFPFLAIGYVVIILGSYFFLGESINLLKLIAILLIISGVVCLSRSDTTERRKN